MTTDINEKVLAAFQAEHKEQLEGIRTCWPNWRAITLVISRNVSTKHFGLLTA